MLSANTGVTAKWIARVEARGHTVWLCNTRLVPHKRIPHHGWHDEEKKRPKAKRPNCDGCTMADIDALEQLALDLMVHYTDGSSEKFTGTPNEAHAKMSSKTIHKTTFQWFYNYHPDTQRCGTKNESGSLSARCNTRLNALRFGSEEAREAFQQSCPEWLRERFRNDDKKAFVAVENIVITFQEVVNDKRASRRFFMKALANYANARRCQQYSTWNYLVSEETRSLVNPAAHELWTRWIEWKSRQITQ